MVPAVKILYVPWFRSFVLQVPQGYPAWAGESGGGVQEAHRARAAGQPRGEDHQGCRGEPQEQRVHLLNG